MYDSIANNIDQEQERYLQARMDEVSRSFALVVPMLEPPFNHHMATAYLLCRVLDNIEDCTQPMSWRRQRFDEFLHLLREPDHASEIVARWEVENWPGLTRDEERMMTLDGGLPLWRIYADLPMAASKSIQRWAATMARGMSDIEDPTQAPRLKQHEEKQVLETPADYNQYCFVVAGTVGHMATELAIQRYDLPQDVSMKLIDNCEACGRALQKTNIIKDFAKDLERGVSFIPDTWLAQADYRPLELAGASKSWQRMVLSDVLTELRNGTDYATALPYYARGYRMAALLCLLPAYETIYLAAQRQERLFTARHEVKISRIKMAQCKRRAKAMLGDNDAIIQYSHVIEAAILREFD